MDIPIVRQQFAAAGKPLRRARWLYGRLIYRELLRNPDMTIICAQRAIARGLYSSKTDMKSVIFSLVRMVFKNSCEWRGDTWAWHRWLREVNHADWNRASTTTFRRYKNGKPLLRIVA